MAWVELSHCVGYYGHVNKCAVELCKIKNAYYVGVRWLFSVLTIRFKRSADIFYSPSAPSPMTTAKKFALFESKHMPRARRVNSIEGARLQHRLSTLERERTRAVRLNNQDITLITSTLDFIESCTGRSPEGVAPAVSQPRPATAPVRRWLGKVRKESARLRRPATAVTSAPVSYVDVTSSSCSDGSSSDSDSLSSYRSDVSGNRPRSALAGKPRNSSLKITARGVINVPVARPKTSGILRNQSHELRTADTRVTSAPASGRTSAAGAQRAGSQLHMSQNRRKEFVESLRKVNEQRALTIQSRLDKFLDKNSRIGQRQSLYWS